MTQPDLTPDEREELLKQWSTRVMAELGVPDLPLDIDTVLSLAGKAAGAVVRPAAPLTTFIAGYAAGRAAGAGTATPHAAVKAAIEASFELCRAHVSTTAANTTAADSTAASYTATT